MAKYIFNLTAVIGLKRGEVQPHPDGMVRAFTEFGEALHVFQGQLDNYMKRALYAGDDSLEYSTVEVTYTSMDMEEDHSGQILAEFMVTYHSAESFFRQVRMFITSHKLED
jgi:hypothetical protein